MYWATLTFWCVTANILLRHTDTQTYNDSITLRSNLLTNYNSKERPLQDLSTAINVSMHFELVSIQDVGEVTGVLSVTGYLFLTWVDEKLTWDSSSYGGLSSLYFGINEIWNPNIVLKTSSEALESFTENWMLIRVYQDGVTAHFPSGIFRTICNIDVKYYPFDRQVCTVYLAIFAYLGNEVRLRATHNSVQTSNFLDSNGEWNLESTSVEVITYGDDSSDEIKFHFTLKRRPNFLIVNVILPILFMTYLNLLVFILPVECGERVGFAVTVLLALAVFLTLVSDNLPKSAEPMSMFGYYLMVILIISICIVVVTALNLTLYFKQGNVPRWCENLSKKVPCWRKESKEEDCARRNQVSPTKESSAGLNENIGNAEGVTAAAEGKADKADAGTADITWQDVSYAVDVIFLTAFFIMLSLTNTVFMAILASN